MFFLKKPTRDSGNLGETLACNFLRKKGYTHLESNYTCRIGEIDLIFRDRKTLVFVEVKLRKSSYFGQAEEYVNLLKQQKIIKVAKFYLQKKNLSDVLVRFDVVGITKIKDNWKCTHYENAFLVEE